MRLSETVMVTPASSVAAAENLMASRLPAASCRFAVVPVSVPVWTVFAVPLQLKPRFVLSVCNPVPEPVVEL